MARRGENIHKRKDGRWEGRYIKARTPEGKIQWGYKTLADKEEKVIFGGRLGEYKYYDMDATIAAVLEKCEQIL